jgi:hypothetical protein
MSAPPSISTSATSTSSLLAVQCSGVSANLPPLAATFGSAPACSSILATAGPLTK